VDAPVTHRDARTPVPCRTCKQPMIWAVLPSGKACPFDANHNEMEGTHTLHYDQSTNTVRAVPLAEGTRSPLARQSHFKTCPQASSHSRHAKPRGKTVKAGDALKGALPARSDDAEEPEP
jgi:hypothetical protein